MQKNEDGWAILTTFAVQKLFSVKWILFVILCLTWGSSFIIMKGGMEILSPYQLASIRIISAGLIMLPWIRTAYRAVPKKAVPALILSGFLGTLLPAYLFCIAQTKIDSSIAGILNALTPIFTLAIGMLFFNLKVGWIKWVGMLLGFAGMLVLVFGASRQINLQYIGYTFFVIIATICYGLNVNVVNQYLKDVAPLHIATIAFTALIIPNLIILASTGYFTDPNLLNGRLTRGTIAGVVLGIVSTCLASVIFYTLMKKAGPVFASMVTYGIPLVALGWGFVAGETITGLQVAGMAVILAGVRLANK
jgi:drug/metabolite transporter (DMT)-like permease